MCVSRHDPFGTKLTLLRLTLVWWAKVGKWDLGGLLFDYGYHSHPAADSLSPRQNYLTDAECRRTKSLIFLMLLCHKNVKTPNKKCFVFVKRKYEARCFLLKFTLKEIKSTKSNLFYRERWFWWSLCLPDKINRKNVCVQKTWEEANKKEERRNYGDYREANLTEDKFQIRREPCLCIWDERCTLFR